LFLVPAIAVQLLKQPLKKYYDLSSLKMLRSGAAAISGTAPYNITGWLEKNKDPLNDTAVDQFKKFSSKLVRRSSLTIPINPEEKKRLKVAREPMVPAWSINLRSTNCRLLGFSHAISAGQFWGIRLER